jgi:alkanesulfonate monooxygenase SsuD/methylene tetrahydromethanopterin reductase-like flavin-dependent oxidoreductase (luciferase family)
MSRLGIAFSGGADPAEIVECVKLAETLGYESAWVAEGHGGDQFAVLSACAVQTSTILLGTSISSVFVRTAPTIAMAAATVDAISAGRFILGIGSSHKVQVEPEHGVPYGKPLTRVRESVEVIRALLRDGRVRYAGETIRIESFDLWFTPCRRAIPIYLSGVFPKMTALCGEIADGVMLTRSTLSTAASVSEWLSEGAKRAGRDPKEIVIASRCRLP